MSIPASLLYRTGGSCSRLAIEVLLEVVPEAEKFGECFVVTEETKLEELPNKTTASCVRISAWPSENVTMGELIQRDLRVVAFNPTDRWSEECFGSES